MHTKKTTEKLIEKNTENPNEDHKQVDKKHDTHIDKQNDKHSEKLTNIKDKDDSKVRKHSYNDDLIPQEQSKAMHRATKSIISSPEECSLLYSDEEINVKKCETTQLHGKDIKVKVTK